MSRRWVPTVASDEHLQFITPIVYRSDHDERKLRHSPLTPMRLLDEHTPLTVKQDAHRT